MSGCQAEKGLADVDASLLRENKVGRCLYALPSAITLLDDCKQYVHSAPWAEREISQPVRRIESVAILNFQLLP